MLNDSNYQRQDGLHTLRAAPRLNSADDYVADTAQAVKASLGASGLSHRMWLRQYGLGVEERGSLFRLLAIADGSNQYVSVEKANVFRKALGLMPAPGFDEAPVCPVHGVVHVCNCAGHDGRPRWRAKRPPKRLSDVSAKTLAQWIRERKEI